MMVQREVAERIAAAWADNRTVTQIVVKPDWTRHGKSAPFKRNDRLLEIRVAGVEEGISPGDAGELVDEGGRDQGSGAGTRQPALRQATDPRVAPSMFAISTNSAHVATRMSCSVVPGREVSSESELKYFLRRSITDLQTWATGDRAAKAGLCSPHVSTPAGTVSSSADV